MYGRDDLLEAIMSLRHTEIPYRSAKNKGQQVKPKKQRKHNPITPDSRYSHLVAEGSRLDLTVERRMEIREELTLIRKKKRLLMKNEYD